MAAELRIVHSVFSFPPKLNKESLLVHRIISNANTSQERIQDFEVRGVKTCEAGLDRGNAGCSQFYVWRARQTCTGCVVCGRRVVGRDGILGSSTIEEALNHWGLSCLTRKCLLHVCLAQAQKNLFHNRNVWF